VIASGVGECGSSGHESEGIGNADFYSFRQSVGLLHGTVPPSPIENNQSRGSVSTRSNDEPRSLEYQPPGTTRTRRSWSFQGRRDQHRRWLWKKQIRRIVLGEFRSEVGGEAVVEREGRIHLRPQRGHLSLRPEGRYKSGFDTAWQTKVWAQREEGWELQLKAEIDFCPLIIFLDPPVDTESPLEGSVIVSFAVDRAFSESDRVEIRIDVLFDGVGARCVRVVPPAGSVYSMDSEQADARKRPARVNSGDVP
jgi:hypothetical protein